MKIAFNHWQRCFAAMFLGATTIAAVHAAGRVTNAEMS